MKKHIAFIISFWFIFLTSGCNQSNTLMPLEELPDTYSLEQAKEDGCIVHENGDITQGREAFEAFYNATTAGKTDEIRLAFYYTLDDPSRYDPEYYESIKDNYPCMYVQDLSFDGEQYTIHWYEDGEEIIGKYSYLMKYEGQAESPGAVYKSYIRYVLTNDNKVTWQKLMHGMLSSQFGDYIEHQSVCTELIYE